MEYFFKRRLKLTAASSIWVCSSLNAVIAFSFVSISIRLNSISLRYSRKASSILRSFTFVSSSRSSYMIYKCSCHTCPHTLQYPLLPLPLKA